MTDTSKDERAQIDEKCYVGAAGARGEAGVSLHCCKHLRRCDEIGFMGYPCM